MPKISEGFIIEAFPELSRLSDQAVRRGLDKDLPGELQLLTVELAGFYAMTRAYQGEFGLLDLLRQ